MKYTHQMLLASTSALLVNQAYAAVSDLGVFGYTLQECERFALRFANTCTGTTTPYATGTITDQAGEEYTCTGDDTWCADETSSDAKTDTCTFKHTMCVTCSQSNDVVSIRVQTNTFPNHCWQTNNVPNVPQYMSKDYEVTWNADMTNIMNYSEDQFTSSWRTTSIMCDIQRTSSTNMHSSITYTEPSTGPARGEMTTQAGTAITGGNIFNALDAENRDAVEYEIQGLDQCLSHSTGYGELHYHSLTPCTGSSSIGSTTEKPGLCSDTSSCVSTASTHTFIQQGWMGSIDNYGGIYGVARDGHVIYGPYNADGELWSCEDHDVCNGFFTESGPYAYASTANFPYIVGCWGPGPTQKYDATCTSFGCVTAGAINMQMTYAVVTSLFAGYMSMLF